MFTNWRFFIYEAKKPMSKMLKSLHMQRNKQYLHIKRTLHTLYITISCHSTQVTIRGPYKQRGSYRNEEMSSKSRSRKKAVYPSSGSWKTLETRKTEPSLCCAVPGLTHKLSAASNHSNKMANNFQVYWIRLSRHLQKKPKIYQTHSKCRNDVLKCSFLHRPQEVEIQRRLLAVPGCCAAVSQI